MRGGLEKWLIPAIPDPCPPLLLGAHLVVQEREIVERVREMCVRGESVYFYDYKIHLDCYSGASTVSYYCLGNHIGNMLWNLFCDFLDLFPIHGEQIPI